MTRPEAMRLVTKMYESWTAPEISRYLAGHGVQVSVRTVRRWGTGEDTTEDNRRNVERRRDTRAFARITALRKRRVSFTAIASVLSEDFGCEVTGEQVRRCVVAGRMKSELRETLWPFPGHRPKEFVPGALRTASPRVESRPESMRGEPQVGGCDVRFPTPSPWGES